MKDTGKGGMDESENVVRRCQGHDWSGVMIMLQSCSETCSQDQPRRLKYAETWNQTKKMENSARFHKQ